MDTDTSKPIWNCPGCGEKIEADFDACWKCGAKQDGTTTPDFTPETEVDISADGSENQAGMNPVVVTPAIVCGIFLSVTFLLCVFQNHLPSYSKYLINIVATITFCSIVAFIAGVIISLTDVDKNDSPNTPKKFQPDLVKDKKLCHNCLEPNFPREHFCVKCAAPISSHAEIDPLGQVYAMGDTYRKAANRPTRPFVVWAMWLLLGPQIPLILFGLFDNVGEWIRPKPFYDDFFQISNLTQSQSFFATSGGVGLMLLLLVIYAAILYKVTNNYYRLKNAQANSEL
ncbi:MAG: hypothetical protein GY869_04400 [Planctomycetes bacterium]|nr:hypothetical protein [Planctomycetota bacterium]